MRENSMLISRNLMISVIIFVGVVFIALLVYTFTRSYLTNKKVKESERAHELLFMAKMQAQNLAKEENDKEKLKNKITLLGNEKLSDYAAHPLDEDTPKQPIVTAEAGAPETPIDMETGSLSDYFQPQS